MKRIFSVFLCLTVWLSVFAYDFEVGGIYYYIIGNGQVGGVTRQDYNTQNPYYSYSSYSGTFTIPSSVTYNSVNYSVTSIGNFAFLDCSGLTSVTIPSSVTSIGNYAFSGCSSLDTLNFLANVETIAKSVISGCYNLKSLAISSSVTSIEDSAFASCNNIRVITCYATTPPDITSTTFANYDATLYVPSSCVDVYSSTIYWRKFYIQAVPDEPAALEYSLADRNVIYCNDIVYNEDGLDIKLFDASGRIISSGNGNIEMSSCPTGIYIVTDGKGGFLKINHYR